MDNIENESVSSYSEQESTAESKVRDEEAFKKSIAALEVVKDISNKRFYKGMFIGCGAMFLVMALIMGGVILILGGKLKKAQTVSTSSADSLSSSVLDADTIKKVNDMLKNFEDLSILELDKEKFQRAILDGVIKGSGDKYAQYYNEEEIQDLMGGYGGTFFGIGATLSLNSAGYAEVQGVYTDSPAAKSGVRDGDIITKVDGNEVYGLTLDEIVKMVRGDKGTVVTLTIARDGEKDYIDIDVTRDKITQIVVEYEMLDNNIGFIHIEQWYDTTTDQFVKAKDELEAKGMKGLIIDVRSNTGGLLKAVVGVCQNLLPEGLVVYTENNSGRSSAYESDGKHEINVPVVILTNGYTASASEILTGAMKDHGKAITIGTKTYGKGVVQSFYSFSDGTAMKLTTEQYFTPNGIAIDGIGISPDIEVEFDSDAYYSETDSYDNQLDAAIDYLMGVIK